MGQIETALQGPILPIEPFRELRIVGLGGTTRAHSNSEKVLRRALHFAEILGAKTQLIAGEALPQEIYDPVASHRSWQAKQLVSALREADALIVATPSYHGSVSGYIKNALDFVEDMRSDARPYLDGIPVCLISCAMGWQAGGATLSAMRSIIHSLRGWPTPLGVIINTSAITIDARDGCSDPAVDNQIATMVHQALRFADMSAARRLLDAEVMAT